jgi:hypothetical protein
MTVLAATAARKGADEFLALAFLLLAAWMILSLFGRRIGGKGGGSEKAGVGAWVLLAAVVVGLLVATGGH